MARLLVSSHTGRSTGFGRIAAGIARSLAVDHDVHVVGLGRGQAGDVWTGHFHHPDRDPTRTSTLAALVGQSAPDVVILVGQGQLLAWQVTRLRRDGFSGVILSYVPLEGRVRDPRPLVGLELSTAVIAYTATGAASLTAALKMGGERPLITSIPHAIEAAAFSVGEAREQLRKELFPEFAHRAEGTWVLNANRNDNRKRPELTLEAFASIATIHPEATLVLHCQPDRRGLDLRIERDRLGLRGRVIITREIQPELWSDIGLGQLYASCEIGVNSAIGEGWGLVAFEHALRGGAQILPAHEGLREIWGTEPLWIPVKGDVPADDVFSGQIPDTEALSKALLQLIEQPGRARRIAGKCATRASDPALRWETVGARWRTLVAQALRHQLAGAVPLIGIG